MSQGFREYIDNLITEGHTIGEDHDDDPVLLDPAGKARLAAEIDTYTDSWLTS